MTPFSTAHGKRKCTQVSFEHLKMEVTEAAFSDCTECRQKELSEGAVTKPPSLLIPALRCFQQAVNQSVKRHRSCKGGRPPSKRVRHGPCPTEEYVSQTAQAFHDVTQCLDIKESEYFFALINQESKFHITAQSWTGASCYGQLTGIAIEDINRKMKIKTPYNTTLKSCEAVDRHFQKLTVERRKRKNSKYYQYVKTRDTLCQLHSNPYSCLLYSAFYYKEALKRARQLVDDMDLILVTTKDSKQMMFRDQYHYENYFRHNDKQTIKSTFRISLLQDKEVAAQIIALASYNGGPGKVRNIFKRLMSKVKGQIWNHNSQQSMLSMLFSKVPWGIPKGDFVDVFSNHLTSQYKKETGEYAKHVLREYEKISKNLAPACGVIPAKEALKPEKQFYDI